MTQLSKYTTEVRYICENAAGYKESKGYADVDKIIEDSIDYVFSFDFPIFDVNYKNVLCTKILRHYYTREIGFETVGLWRLKLETKLNEIMPYFNQLYKSELLKFNPLYDVDLNTTHVGDKQGENNNSSINNRTAENTKEANRNGLSNSNNERTENGAFSKTSNGIEQDNKNVNSSSEGSNASIGNSKTERTAESAESGNNEKNDVKANNYTETQSGLTYDLYSDTPQGALTDVDQEEYLTNARKITDSKSKTGKNDDTAIGNEKYNKNVDNSEEDKSETNSFSNDSVKQEYDETNNRTSLNNETHETSGSTVDSSSKSDIENMKSSENDKSSETAISMDKYKNTESYVLHVVGKQAGNSYSKLLKEFRDTFLNIDMDVINSLSDLFLNLW